MNSTRTLVPSGGMQRTNIPMNIQHKIKFNECILNKCHNIPTTNPNQNKPMCTLFTTWNQATPTCHPSVATQSTKALYAGRPATQPLSR